jgi:hypothetical protein
VAGSVGSTISRIDVLEFSGKRRLFMMELPLLSFV